MQTYTKFCNLPVLPHTHHPARPFTHSPTEFKGPQNGNKHFNHLSLRYPTNLSPNPQLPQIEIRFVPSFNRSVCKEKFPGELVARPSDQSVAAIQLSRNARSAVREPNNFERSLRTEANRRKSGNVWRRKNQTGAICAAVQLIRSRYLLSRQILKQ